MTVFDQSASISHHGAFSRFSFVVFCVLCFLANDISMGPSLFIYLSLLYSRQRTHNHPKPITRLKMADDSEEYRSISDYVGGLHGGKYEFDTRIMGVTALNYEKSRIFGNVAGNKFSKQMVAPALDDDQKIPQWASRKVNLQSIDEVSIPGTVSITNEEISWEPFFATIENELGTSPSTFSIEPKSGKLAPRGGCDVYNDSCEISIDNDGIASATHTQGDLFLIVRTELDSWVWRLRNQGA